RHAHHPRVCAPVAAGAAHAAAAGRGCAGVRGVGPHARRHGPVVPRRRRRAGGRARAVLPPPAVCRAGRRVAQPARAGRPAVARRRAAAAAALRRAHARVVCRDEGGRRHVALPQRRPRVWRVAGQRAARQPRARAGPPPAEHRQRQQGRRGAACARRQAGRCPRHRRRAGRHYDASRLLPGCGRRPSRRAGLRLLGSGVCSRAPVHSHCWPQAHCCPLLCAGRRRSAFCLGQADRASQL
ncbi:hypothetical protein GGF41_001658, partial [Coemansia sp. RSA 2531]